MGGFRELSAFGAPHKGPCLWVAPSGQALCPWAQGSTGPSARAHEPTCGRAGGRAGGQENFEKGSKEKLSKKLADAEKSITNAKNKSLKLVNEIATDIAISLSQKVSGIKANKSTLMKKINEQVSRSGSFKSLKEGN